MENPNAQESTEQVPAEDTTPNTLREDSAKQTWGPLVGVIIIVAIIVLGGLYFWGQKLVTGGDMKDTTSEPDPKREALESQDSSDEVSSIEEDIENTDFSGIDQELGTIESEFNF